MANRINLMATLRRSKGLFLALFALCALSPAIAKAQANQIPGVYGWGDNDQGQVGDATFVQRNTPVHVQAFSVTGALTPLIAIAVAGGEQHSIALDASGSVWAWGDNSFGQLGQGVVGGTATSARRIANLPPVIAIAAGGWHNLAIDRKGQVWAWGRNDFGQIGNNASGVPVSLPVLVEDLIDHQDLLTNVVAIAAGELHSLAVLRDGTVRSWGANRFGALGIGVMDNAVHPLPLKVNGLGSVVPILDGVVIAAGGYHSLAIQSTATGTTIAYSWGANASGQLGDGTFVDNPNPKPIFASTTARLTHVKAVSGGLGEFSQDTSKPVGAYAHSLALMDDGTVRGWGYDRYAQIGNGTLLAVAPYGNPFPQIVKDSASSTGTFLNARVISAGGFHSLANKNDANSFAWGRDDRGQVGDNVPPGSVPLPNQVLGVGAIGFLSNGFTVAGGGKHSLAIVGVSVRGTIQLEGCVNANQTITFLFRPANGSANFTRTIALTPIAAGSSVGKFTFTDIPQQAYEVHIKGAKWLATNAALDTTAGGAALFASLRGGDANDDNSCDIADFGVITSDFGNVGFDPADFTCDDSVDIADFSILTSEFGTFGDL